jgi:allophanate hydrolase
MSLPSLRRECVKTLLETVAAHRAGTLTIEDSVRKTFARIRSHDDPAMFISLRTEDDMLAEARTLQARGPDNLPLFGAIVAVKDNIDVAGLQTTAACPAFAYTPARDATAVARLRAAGALIIGKTNLDQFATGLVGTRSPYGIPRNAMRADLVPGGSSSGSAVAVAAGIVSIALGTDTAGSGRVPAMLNNIVGLKPSLGLIPTSGVVPACRTLDCVSVFARDVDDALAALAVMAGPDADDAYSRSFPPLALGATPSHFKLGVPKPEQLEFFGDKSAASAYDAAIGQLAAMGATIVEIDIAPLIEAAQLLYAGPWVAERYLATKPLIDATPDALHPVTREIISHGARHTAADAFTAFYRLQEIRKISDRLFAPLDALVVPTAPTTYTVAQLQSDPITLNSRLGTYTNFVNLLDLCGLAVPAAIQTDGAPFGVTLLAPCGHDAALAAIGRAFHARTGLTMGATGIPVTQPPACAARVAEGEIALAVVGAHLSGMPLNGELRALSARLLEVTTTTADYRLFALPNTTPPKPGLLRIADGSGQPIAVEVWALTREAFGTFVNQVPAPLAIGTLRLANGETVKGFLVEPEALKGAENVSAFGGWRNFIASRQPVV